jgi:pimeloyl-ACP methyl ester carboxylesterase
LSAPEPAGGKIAYILYTSGSTGQPKGVYQSQRNLLHDVMQYVHSIHLSARDRVTMLYSPGTSGAIRDLFGALLTGASLHMHSLRQAGFARLRERMAAERITVYHSVPPVFRGFLSVPGQFDDVRIVYLAGDRLVPGDVDTFRRNFARGARIYTGIGSTEAATIYLQWFISHDTPLGESVPLGRAIPDRNVRLIDGEIEVSSRYLALGYWRNAPFDSTPGDPECRTFRPGDRARERPDGLFEHLGRKDRQVKIRGYRVEIGEVERALEQHPGAGDVAVVMAGGALVACYTGREPINWQAYLRTRLPSHMIPARFKRLAALPRLGNFKLDRQLLEATMAADFQALGGDSLAALQVSLERGPTLCYLPSIEGSSLGVRVLASALEKYSVRCMTYPCEARSIVEIAAQLRDELPGGPYRLLGYSFGARVAFELARQLALDGETVEFLCVIDTPPSGSLEIKRVPAPRRVANFARRLLASPIRLWPGIVRHMRTRRPLQADASRRVAFLTYEPAWFEGEMVLIRTRGDNLGWGALPEDLGWAQWCRGVRIRYFDGTHDIANPWSAASLNLAVREELELTMCSLSPAID